MSQDLEFVAFDIETSGFETTDVVSVFGIETGRGCRVFCNGADHGVDAGELEVSVNEHVDRVAEATVEVSVHASEAALLEAVGGMVAAEVRGEDKLLVAYNGEQYRGGFDLPFLRTRLAALDVAWPFAELPYADVMPVVTNRFNTTVGDDERRDLAMVYEALLDGSLGSIDPFGSSEGAVEAYENGDFVELVLHNVADVLRTAALAGLTERYCSKSDYQLKSLTPLQHENG